MMQEVLETKIESLGLSLAQESTERELRYFSILNSFAIDLLQQETVEDIAWSVAKDAVAQMGFEDCVVYLVQGDELVQVAAHGSKNPVSRVVLNPINIPIGEGITGHVVKTGQYQWVRDTSLDPRYIVDGVKRNSELSVPIVLESRVIGVIDSEHHEKDFFSECHLKMLTTVASLTATKFAQAFARQELLAYNQQLEEAVERRTQHLAEALRQVSQINDELKQFAYTVSHDLRQPLNTVSGFLQLIDKNALKEEDRKFMTYATEASGHAQRLVTDLLDYARVGGVDAKSFEIVDLNRVVNSVQSVLSGEIESTNTHVVVGILPEIKGVNLLLVQLFQNLISNAIKFKGINNPRVTIQASEQGGKYLIKVSDNGFGIPPEYLERIFELFNRGTAHGQAEGTGIGLAVCKKIMRTHGGDIWVTSEMGQGSCFHLSFPKISEEQLEW
jgi:signal transduction histidine kinase